MSDPSEEGIMSEEIIMRRCIPARRRIPACRTKFPDPSAIETSRYYSVEGMLIAASKKASYISGVPFEEVKAQADLLFVTACRKFDENRGVKFSTFLHSVLHNGLIDFGRHECIHDSQVMRVYSVYDHDVDIDAIDIVEDYKAERSFRFVEMYNSLSLQDRELVDLVLQGYASSLRDLRRLALEKFGLGSSQFKQSVEHIGSLLLEM